MSYHTHEFSTTAIQDRTIDKDQKILAIADILHRVTAHDVNADVDLRNLTAEDIGCSQELANTAQAFMDSGIDIIPSDPIERASVVVGALQIL